NEEVQILQSGKSLVEIPYRLDVFRVRQDRPEIGSQGSPLEQRPHLILFSRLRAGNRSLPEPLPVIVARNPGRLIVGSCQSLQGQHLELQFSRVPNVAGI